MIDLLTRQRARQKTLRIAAMRSAVTLLLGGIVLAGAQIPSQKPHLPRTVLTADAAYIVGEPTFLAGPRIDMVLPAPDGPYVLIVREQPRNAGADLAPPAAGAPLREAQMEILLWNRQTRRVSAVWEQPKGAALTATLSGGICWLPKSSVALASVALYPQTGAESQPQNLLLVIDTRLARARVVPSAPDGVLIPSGDSPVAVLMHYANPAERAQGVGRILHPVGADGRIGPAVSVPIDVQASGPVLNGGTAFYGFRRGAKDPKTGRTTVEHLAVRLSDGAITPLPSRPEAEDTTSAVAEAIQALPIRLTTRRAQLRSNAEEENLTAVYLDRAGGNSEDTPTTPTAAIPAIVPPAAGTKPPIPPAPGKNPKDRDAHALVAVDAEAVTLTPDGGAALYSSRNGGLYGLPIARMDKQAFLEGRRKIYREMAMNNAKQIGLAILMYSQDYDEKFPPGGGDLPSIIDPYLKDSSVFQDPETGASAFTFVSPGVIDMASVKEPANTVVGYVNGPGGRAAIYVDGHVKWEDR